MANERPEPAYDEFGALPESERRVRYGSLGPDVRSALWREHFTRYLDAHPDLSAEQRELIEESLAMTDDLPASVTPEARARDERFRIRAIGLFGEEEARDLFATLGPPGPRSRHGSGPR